jgi:hypothetical protein
MKKSWEDQLNQVLIDDNRDGFFGSNIEWVAKDVKKYITKLENLGAWDIEVPDYDSIQFKLPIGEAKGELLLFILTGGGANGRMPLEASYKKGKGILKLSWDY